MKCILLAKSHLLRDRGWCSLWVLLHMRVRWLSLGQAIYFSRCFQFGFEVRHFLDRNAFGASWCVLLIGGRYEGCIWRKDSLFSDSLCRRWKCRALIMFLGDDFGAFRPRSAHAIGGDTVRMDRTVSADWSLHLRRS